MTNNIRILAWILCLSFGLLRLAKAGLFVAAPAGNTKKNANKAGAKKVGLGGPGNHSKKRK